MTRRTTGSSLLSCVYCDCSRAYLHQGGGRGDDLYWAAYCPDCHALGPASESLAAAVAAWNSPRKAERRITDKPVRPASVWVCWTWYQDEGCSEPQAVFDSEDKAKAWAAAQEKQWSGETTHYRYQPMNIA